ncbi:Mrp/NBP35 family ATP-binding protein [Paenibacillus sp. MER 180]|uniref:Mrp/NBP35 family ATP-binding protein n=1 Tax=unclassified Paenibacillus TaxID=185978 RepID=UPI00080657B3|nr:MULTISPECIES: Mrp/NBP35 family ATP-binding protein [unclassified Paenibacillus]MCM3293760.1 Mrp/NBP35 family ATP-binding protein [Paenibacillus sp. MER 180]OBY79541.1 ATP-binding protein [Paenibacillus sp. KS1]
MTTKEEVLQSLQGLQEPVSGQDMTSLHWIRDMMIKEDEVKLTAIVAPQAADAAAREALVGQIKERLAAIELHNVYVRTRIASEAELSAAGIAVQSGQSATDHAGNGRDSQEGSAPRGHGAGLEQHPILDPASGVKFIAIASGKGGVGKSTVTVNLAVALARLGKRVGLIDADIYGFSVPDMMGIEDRPVVVDNYIIPQERFGVKVMSMGFFVEDNSPVVWRGPMLGKMLRNFFQEVQWGELDYMLLDLPPGTGDVALDIHQMIPHSQEIIVTTPHATAAFVAARAGTMAIHTKHEIIGIVENMSYLECGSCGEKQYVFGRGGGAKLADELHVDLLAQLPLGAPDNHPAEPDYAPSVYKADSSIGKQFDELAAAVDAKMQVVQA